MQPVVAVLPQALCSSITPNMLGGRCVVPRIQTRLIICKAIEYFKPCTMFLFPLMVLNFLIEDLLNTISIALSIAFCIMLVWCK